MSLQPSASPEVITVGAPVIDYVLQVDHDFVKGLRRGRWGMQEINQDRLNELLSKANTPPTLTPGGSAANTAQGLSKLGHTCGHLGAIGSDANGDYFRKHLEKHTIATRFFVQNSPTRQVLCLVTPDGRRTFRAVPGADTELTPEQLTAEHFLGAKLVHIEGYSLLNDGLTERAMQLAKEVGAEVSVDLASHEIAKQHWHKILYLVENYVDIIFCNREEITALGMRSPSHGCQVLSELCKIAVLLLGRRGCLVGSSDSIHAYPSEPVPAVDTTGAGDYFASGFLHGHLNGRPLSECARYGAVLGKAVVQHLGAHIPDEAWPAVFEELNRSLSTK